MLACSWFSPIVIGVLIKVLLNILIKALLKVLLNSLLGFANQCIDNYE